MKDNLRAVRARRCPACDGSSMVERGQKNGFSIMACQQCQTLFTSHLPQQEQTDYDDYYCGETLDIPAFIDKRLDEIIAGFAPYKQNKRLLDIGFGAGTLLQAAERGGWVPTGVDVSKSAVEHVRKLGYDVFCGTLDEAHYPDNHFDVVTASELLEHVPDPLAVVREMGRVLRPGGLLWMTTPHGRGVSNRLLGVEWSILYPPEHIQLFSRKGIEKLLKAVGFRRIRVITQGVNPFEIVEHFKRRKSETAAPAGAVAEAKGHDRVKASYQLNESLMSSPLRRMLKGTVNGLLNAGGMGDSLKVWAEK